MCCGDIFVGSFVVVFKRCFHLFLFERKHVVVVAVVGVIQNATVSSYHGDLAEVSGYGSCEVRPWRAM